MSDSTFTRAAINGGSIEDILSNMRVGGPGSTHPKYRTAQVNKRVLDLISRSLPSQLVGSGRLKKGSPEAKIRMAYLRSRRGKSKNSLQSLRSSFYSQMKLPARVRKGSAAAKRKMMVLRSLRGGNVVSDIFSGLSSTLKDTVTQMIVEAGEDIGAVLSDPKKLWGYIKKAWAWGKNLFTSSEESSKKSKKPKIHTKYTVRVPSKRRMIQI